MTEAEKQAWRAAIRLKQGYGQGRQQQAAKARMVSKWATAMKKVINENGN